MKEITYIKQGNGADSWQIKEFDTNNVLLNVWMEYTLPEGHADTIPQALKMTYDRIDTRTRALIMDGFNFPAGPLGRKWGMTSLDQQVYTDIPNLDTADFPFRMYDSSGTPYDLTQANQKPFLLALARNRQAPIKTGNMLKIQVSQLTNINSILTFVDPR